VEAGELAARLGVRVYIVGIGTEEGRVSRGIQRFPRQEFDVDTLRQIAATTGAEFYRARDVDSLETTFATIDRLEKSAAEHRRQIEQTELFPWFAGIALIAAIGGAVIHALNPPPGN